LFESIGKFYVRPSCEKNHIKLEKNMAQDVCLLAPETENQDSRYVSTNTKDMSCLSRGDPAADPPTLASMRRIHVRTLYFQEKGYISGLKDCRVCATAENGVRQIQIGPFLTAAILPHHSLLLTVTTSSASWHNYINKVILFMDSLC